MPQQCLRVAHPPFLDVLGERLTVHPLEGLLELRGAHARDRRQIRQAQARRAVVVDVERHLAHAFTVDGGHRFGLAGGGGTRALDDEAHRLEDLALVVQRAARAAPRSWPQPGQKGAHLREGTAVAQRGERPLDLLLPGPGTVVSREFSRQTVLREAGRDLNGNALDGGAPMGDSAPGAAPDALPPDGARPEPAIGLELLAANRFEPRDREVPVRGRVHDEVPLHHEVVDADAPFGALRGQVVEPAPAPLAIGLVGVPQWAETIGRPRRRERSPREERGLERLLHHPVLSSYSNRTRIRADRTEFPGGSRQSRPNSYTNEEKGRRP